MHKVSQLEQPLVWNNFPGLSKFLKNGDKNEKVSEKILNTNSFTPITFQGCQVSLIWHDTHAFRAFLMLSGICRPSVTNGGNSKLYARSCPNSPNSFRDSRLKFWSFFAYFLLENRSKK